MCMMETKFKCLLCQVSCFSSSEKNTLKRGRAGEHSNRAAGLVVNVNLNILFFLQKLHQTHFEMETVMQKTQRKNVNKKQSQCGRGLSV